MEIRRYRNDDELRRALEAHNRAWRVGFRGIVPRDVVDAKLKGTNDAELAVLEQRLVDEPERLTVAAVDGTVVGYVRMRYGGTYDFVPMIGAEILELAVDPAHWRNGIGTALLKAGVDRLPDTVQGVTVSVLAADERARSFLEANGLVHEDDETVEIAEESIDHAIYRDKFEE